MAPVTELVLSTLKPGVSAESLYPIFATLKSQPGNTAVRAAPPSEDPSQIRLFIDWDDIAAHQAFRATDAYKSYLGQLAPYVTTPTQIMHAELTPFPPVVLEKSPSTEFLLLYIDPDEDEAKVLQAGKTLARGLTADGIKGTTGLSAVGLTVEKDVEYKGEKVRVMVMLLGWESDEAHRTASATDPAFKAAQVEFHEAIPDLKGFKIEHVAAKVL
ncbi:uncharacterized protein F4807DRAFT_179757 [Annulohypoxylon truncatum]|uniref:uncharacterized protein n=1 Tax=Annulohypoxylon truncatum TaxID=327061 RepID=UPI00200828B3|nr:uncharacterized protein F4807DRAFT_179757 [Annulohypoxylon truncatum]KAI1207510.1 hypothetical protein F4807DRAFT_179757 [Annulohypoxylon truncatum]